MVFLRLKSELLLLKQDVRFVSLKYVFKYFILGKEVEWMAKEI